MSALAADIPALGAGRLALLGTGTVGSAFVQRYQALQARGLELPSVQWLANHAPRWRSIATWRCRWNWHGVHRAMARVRRHGPAPKGWSVATWWSMPPPAKTWPRATCSGWRAACTW
jgi:hypothetical protein